MTAIIKQPATGPAVRQESQALVWSDQDSMYRMGVTVFAEITETSLTMPNKHYIPINLKPFRLENRDTVFLPTDELHGQIEATIDRAE